MAEVGGLLGGGLALRGGKMPGPCGGAVTLPRHCLAVLAEFGAVSLVGQEKGIDVRIALDVVRLAQQDAYDVGVVFSQDQDLSEAADEVRLIAREQQRWIKLAAAFPFSPTAKNGRGVNKTDWIAIDRATYDSCLDKRDCRPKGTATP